MNLYEAGRRFPLFPDAADAKDEEPVYACAPFSFLNAGFPCNAVDSDQIGHPKKFISLR